MDAKAIAVTCVFVSLVLVGVAAVGAIRRYMAHSRKVVLSKSTMEPRSPRAEDIGKKDVCCVSACHTSACCTSACYTQRREVANALEVPVDMSVEADTSGEEPSPTEEKQYIEELASVTEVMKSRSCALAKGEQGDKPSCARRELFR